MIRSALIVALLVLPGCFIHDTSVGGPLPAHYDQLEIGVTTKGEALALLGAPHTVRRQSDGDLYLYGRVHDYSERLQLIPILTFYERTEGQIHSDRLVLLFDHAGILQGIGVEQEIPAEG